MRRTYIFLLLLVSSFCAANTYYVSPTGDNTASGKAGSPWATWGKAFQNAVAGDTVFFRGGVYNAGINLGYANIANSGTVTDPICFLNYPNESPILDGSSVTPGLYTYPIYVYGRNNIIIKGLTVRNFTQKSPTLICAFMVYNARNIHIENCVAHGIGGQGYTVSASYNVRIKNCDAYDLCDTLSTRPGQNGDGFQIWTDALLDGAGMYDAKLYVEGCRAWDFGDNGFTCYGHGYMEFRDCWAYNGGRFTGEGCGFKYGFSSYSDGVTNPSRYIVNCIAANNGYYGFGPNSSVPFKGQYYNNFSYHNGYKHSLTDWTSDYGIGWRYVGVTPMEGELLANNIAYANENTNVNYIPGFISRHNSWNNELNVQVTDEDFQSLDMTQLILPRKSDGSLPDITFGKLAAGSDLIDAGINVGLPYLGQAPDLGWHEYSSTVDPVTPNLVFISSVIETATPSRLEMSYSLALANIIPPVSAFAVKVNNVTRSISAVAISGTKVLLTLASPVVYGEIVTVAYTKPASNPIQTSAGGQAASITSQNVTNNVAAINNQPPVVSISSPTKSTGFVAPAAITIDANASDPDGSVTKVEFYNGASKLGEITTAPYSYTWKEVPTGTYSITAAATDNKGLKTVSAAVTVVVEKSATTVNQLPSVSVKIPNEKKPKKHDNVVIVAEASDPDGSINKVELKNGDVTIAEMTTAPYVFTLQNVDTGTYVITAIATDNLGAVSISDALELRIEDFYNPDLISLYPNPNKGFFKIDILEELPAQDCILSVFSLTGATVYQDIVKPGETFKEIERSDLQSGQYVLMLTSGKTILTTKKFIKQ